MKVEAARRGLTFPEALDSLLGVPAGDGTVAEAAELPDSASEPRSIAAASPGPMVALSGLGQVNPQMERFLAKGGKK